MCLEESAIRILQNWNNTDIIDIKREFNHVTKYETIKKYIALFSNDLVL
jgi:hypothetical protein